MTLLETMIKDGISINFSEDPMFGTDEVYESYPCPVATVTFSLMDTDILNRAADRIRVEEGYRPLYPVDGYSEEMCVSEGFYGFTIEINQYTNTHVSSCILFSLEGSSLPDEDLLYLIDLSEEEQIAIYERLDEQCRKYLGKSCEDLLKDAEKEMMDYFYDD